MHLIRRSEYLARLRYTRQNHKTGPLKNTLLYKPPINQIKDKTQLPNSKPIPHAQKERKKERETKTITTSPQKKEIRKNV